MRITPDRFFDAKWSASMRRLQTSLKRRVTCFWDSTSRPPYSTTAAAPSESTGRRPSRLQVVAMNRAYSSMVLAVRRISESNSATTWKSLRKSSS